MKMSTPTVQRIELDEIAEREPAADGKPLVDRDFSLIRDVSVEMSAVIGHARLSVDALFALKSGEVLKLEQGLDEPMTFYLAGKPVARGNLVAVDDHFGIQVTEVL